MKITKLQLKRIIKEEIDTIVEWGEEVEYPDFIKKLSFTSSERELSAAYAKADLTDEEKALVDADRAKGKHASQGRFRMLLKIFHKRATDPMHSKSGAQKDEWMKILKDKYIDVETIGEPHHGDYAGKPLPGGQLAVRLDYEVARELADAGTPVPEDFIKQARQKLVPQNLGHLSGPAIGSPEERLATYQMKLKSGEILSPEEREEQEGIAAAGKAMERERSQKASAGAWEERMIQQHGQLPGGQSYQALSPGAIRNIEKETETERLRQHDAERSASEKERGERLRTAPPARGRSLSGAIQERNESISRKKLKRIIHEELKKFLRNK